MMEELLSFTVTEEEAGRMVGDVLRKRHGVSRRLLIRAKFHGEIKKNGIHVYVNERLAAGDRIILSVPQDELHDIEPEQMPLSIRYEDDDLLILVKPAGLVVHPTHTHLSGTLANGVIAYYLSKGESRKFRAVNRLDKDTSGLMIVAKNQWAHEQCARMQKERTLKRTYQAIVHGCLEHDSGVIDDPIGMREGSFIERMVRPDGQPAQTGYRVLGRGAEMTWVELQLETGRTHQIRVHLAHLGHPLLGDDLYGGSRELISRQALHAIGLSFTHPRGGEQIVMTEPLPEDMKQILHQVY